jgi:endo-1,4-beta-xylanase
MMASLQNAARSGLMIGCALMSAQLSDPLVASMVASQFGCITAENEMKPSELYNHHRALNFSKADKIVEFARAKGLRVIGHTLVWHNSTPQWMFEDDGGHPLSREAALANMRTHIFGVLAHFKGQIHGWDVANEALSDNLDEYLRDSPARRAIGDDWVLQAFRFANEADPSVALYYNDYNIEMDYKRSKAIRLIRELRAAGVHISALGIQGHLMLGQSVEELARGLDELAAEKIDLMITELDIDPLPRPLDPGVVADVGDFADRGTIDPYRAGLPPATQERLADMYRRVVHEILRHGSVTRISFWGISDAGTWLDYYPVQGRTNHPLLFDRALRTKPAYDAVLQELASRRS